MKFIRSRTTVPVPQVHDAYTDEESGMVRIVMEYIPGNSLDAVWDTYTDSQKESVIAQLRGYMSKLREIKGDFIGSIDGTWCNDHYFDNDPEAYGPFPSEAEFNCDVFLEVMKGHGIVMTHNDLEPRNILVRGSEAVALLDWELSGYYPEYWEYCKAMRRPNWESGWVRDRALERVIKPYRMELSVIWNTTEIIW
ncbi:kinase-like domain-containing protein [Plectosphaerella cucumerina]|uniref:Kinase-like domain-containing protein n=1 Tax=Plectosphaerella cucumerina TaxID=40658 RepID=A0A8K0X0N7_9PEZI|nr:kinase-like domain-containing protein [Plectosphaerella cucumerina]